MEKLAGSFSGSTVLPAQLKNLKLIRFNFFDVFYEIKKRKFGYMHKKSEFSKKFNFFWRLFSQKEFSEAFPENDNVGNVVQCYKKCLLTEWKLAE